ncbi:MAG TPA: ComEC/Rec2 family competence protein, partial [Anaerolineaceae bacterium]|nr:ComEC/Rec2 family competence protein [Anaerolineaceae bacterium]
FTTQQPVWGPQDLAYYQPQSAQVRGVLIQPPQPAGQAVRIYLEVEQLVLLDEGGQPLDEPLAVRGRLAAVLRAGQELRYGDRVELTGLLAQPPEGDRGSYMRYLAGQGINSYMEYPLLHWVRGDAGSPFWAGLYRLRQNGVDTLNRILPQPESSLLAGILLGVKDYIPTEVEDAFRATGTAHIVAISGFNISILIGLFIGFFRRWLPRLWAVLWAVVAIALYTLLVGAQASVVRAAIMGVMGLVGAELGRRQAGANSLAFTAAVMALFNPLLLWDVGFQLSFTATLGLILLGEPMQNAFTAWLERRLPAERARKVAGPVGEYFLLTLAAQLATLPVIMGNFGKFSLSAIVANPLVLPVQPLVMILGGLSLLAGMLWLPLGQLLAWLVWPLLAYTIRVVQLLAQIAGGVNITGMVGLAFAALFYSLVFGFGLWRRLLGRWFRLAVLMVAIGLVAALVTRAALAAPDGRLHVLVLDGDKIPVIFIRTPNGETLLINSGESAVELTDTLGRWLPPFSDSLDYLLVPGKTRAAIGALPDVLERYLPKKVLWNNKARSGSDSERLLEGLQNQRVTLDFMERGQEIDLGSGARLRVEVISVEGAALSLAWGNFRLWIPGGILPATLERQQLDWPDSPGILLLGPADLKNDTPEGWSALAPDLLIWLGEDTLQDEYGGVMWLSLREAGWLHFTTDGEQVWLESGN